MRVAFDEQIFAIQRHGGISRVFAELAHQFLTDPTLGVNLQPVAAPLVNEYLLRDLETREKLVVKPAQHWAPTLARSMLRRRHHGPADIVHNTFYLPRALKDYPQAKRVVTVHDMIPELFPDTRRRLDFLTVKKRYVEEADHIVCVSESTKSDLIRLYGPPNAPVSVVPSGVGREFAPGAPPLTGWPESYLLFVGHRGGYKDVATLWRAFARISSEHPSLYLVHVGGGPLSTHENAHLQELGIAERVWQCQVPDGQMAAAYGNAQIFVFPSKYEGFGLPVLEAMACGTPTVLCNASSLPEVGGQAAAYFDPEDDRQLAELLNELLGGDLARTDMSRKGIDRAANFTWSRTAVAMTNVYRAVVEGNANANV